MVSSETKTKAKMEKGRSGWEEDLREEWEISTMHVIKNYLRINKILFK